MFWLKDPLAPSTSPSARTIQSSVLFLDLCIIGQTLEMPELQEWTIAEYLHLTATENGPQTPNATIEFFSQLRTDSPLRPRIAQTLSDWYRTSGSLEKPLSTLHMPPSLEDQLRKILQYAANGEMSEAAGHRNEQKNNTDSQEVNHSPTARQDIGNLFKMSVDFDSIAGHPFKNIKSAFLLPQSCSDLGGSGYLPTFNLPIHEPSVDWKDPWIAITRYPGSDDFLHYWGKSSDSTSRQSHHMLKRKVRSNLGTPKNRPVNNVPLRLTSQHHISHQDKSLRTRKKLSARGCFADLSEDELVRRACDASLRLRRSLDLSDAPLSLYEPPDPFPDHSHGGTTVAKPLTQHTQTASFNEVMHQIHETTALAKIKHDTIQSTQGKSRTDILMQNRQYRLKHPNYGFSEAFIDTYQYELRSGADSPPARTGPSLRRPQVRSEWQAEAGKFVLSDESMDDQRSPETDGSAGRDQQFEDVVEKDRTSAASCTDDAIDVESHSDLMTPSAPCETSTASWKAIPGLESYWDLILSMLPYGTPCTSDLPIRRPPINRDTRVFAPSPLSHSYSASSSSTVSFDDTEKRSGTTCRIPSIGDGKEGNPGNSESSQLLQNLSSCWLSQSVLFPSPHEGTDIKTPDNAVYDNLTPSRNVMTRSSSTKARSRERRVIRTSGAHCQPRPSNTISCEDGESCLQIQDRRACLLMQRDRSFMLTQTSGAQNTQQALHALSTQTKSLRIPSSNY